MNGYPLTSIDYQKRLESSYIYIITFNYNPNFHQHTSEVTLKANCVLACMKRAFVDLNNDVFFKVI